MLALLLMLGSRSFAVNYMSVNCPVTFTSENGGLWIKWLWFLNKQCNTFVNLPELKSKVCTSLQWHLDCLMKDCKRPPLWWFREAQLPKSDCQTPMDPTVYSTQCKCLFLFFLKWLDSAINQLFALLQQTALIPGVLCLI